MTVGAEPLEDLLGDLLAQQADLTPVDRFSRAHDANRLPHTDDRYRELIPSAAPGPGTQYAFEVDLDACSGCKACVVACHNLNGLDEGESWRKVGTVVGGPLPLADGLRAAGPREVAGLVETADIAGGACGSGGGGGCGTGHGTNDESDHGHGAAIGTASGPMPVVQHVTSACHHCVEPACMDGCPVNAYDKDPITGIVSHLDDQCIGCTYCQFTCPYEVPTFNAKRGIVRKCDMCVGRLQEGEPPACVQSCPTHAIRITTISTSAAAEPDGEWPLPGVPSRTLTKPTTVYKTSRDLTTSARAADWSTTRPGHSHTPLAIMLVLTQLSVGTLAVELALRALGLIEGAAGSLTAGVLGITALVASVFHLGRPLQAWRAWIGLRHSWLSREIVAFGAYAGLAVAWAALVDVTGWVTGAAATALQLAAVGVGLAGVGCSVMIYAVTGRRLWATHRSAGRFAGTTVVGGLAVSTALAAATGLSSGTVAGLALGWGLAGLAHLGHDLSLLRHRRDPGSELGRTATLLGRELRGQSWARLWSGVAASACVPLLVAVTALGLSQLATSAIMATAGVVGVIASEVIARRLYFSAAVAPRMPGALP